MKTRKLILSGAVLLATLGFTSCDKNDNPETNIETDVTEQTLALDDIVESVVDELDAVLSVDTEPTATSLKSTVQENTCLTVTFANPEDATFPRIITFDYGTENCEDRHGRLKRGKVIVTVTGPYWIADSQRTVEFEDFYVNDNKVEGTRIYKNEGQNGDLNWEFSMNVNVTIETTEGKTWTRTATKTRTLIAGADTPRYPWDDEFLVTGTSSGSSSDGYSVTREITTPIYRTRACRFPLSGVIEIVRTIDDISETTWLDYGTGECDYTATVRDSDGNENTITLGKRFMRK